MAACSLGGAQWALERSRRAIVQDARRRSVARSSSTRRCCSQLADMATELRGGPRPAPARRVGAGRRATPDVGHAVRDGEALRHGHRASRSPTRRCSCTAATAISRTTESRRSSATCGCTRSSKGRNEIMKLIVGANRLARRDEQVTRTRRGRLSSKRGRLGLHHAQPAKGDQRADPRRWSRAITTALEPLAHRRRAVAGRRPHRQPGARAVRRRRHRRRSTTTRPSGDGTERGRRSGATSTSLECAASRATRSRSWRSWTASCWAAASESRRTAATASSPSGR